MRLGIEERDLLGEFVRFPHVVGIEECDVFTPGMLDPKVARGTHAAVLVSRMFKVADFFWITFRVAARDRGAPVGGTVVHEHQLPVFVGLCQNASDRFVDEAFPVEEDDRPGDERLRRRRITGKQAWGLTHDSGRSLSAEAALRSAIITK